MENKVWFQLQSWINDIVGTGICITSLKGLFQHPGEWTFVVVIFIGATMVFGRNLGKYIRVPGIGGGNEEETQTVDKSA